MSERSSIKNNSKNYKEENSFNEQKNENKIERKYSLDSFKSDSNFDNLNAEIKAYLQNEADLSFSNNSNSESQEPQINIDYLLDSKFWQTNKDFQLENENQNEKEMFSIKNNLLLLNDNEKISLKNLNSKNNIKRDSEGSNKQSTQSNEDEETRIEHLHNISDSISNNSPLNSLSNNESEDNEINSVQFIDKNNLENILNKEKEESKNNIDVGGNNNKLKDNKNIIGPNSLLCGLQLKNDSEFVFSYEPINYINNQNKNATNHFFNQGSYLNQQFCSFNSNYNLPSPLNKRSIISFNNNISNKINSNYSEKKNEEYFKKESTMNINGQNNKFINFTINDYNKKLNQNQKEIIDLPLIINQNNNQNIPINYNCSKLNLNMTYYPKMQNNNNFANNIQLLDKISNSSNYLPNLSNKNNNSYINLSEKKIKNNILFEEHKNSSNNINNSLNNILYNNKLKMNYKNNITNKNINNSIINKSLKGEKQILNLDDIVTGKDMRTTVMIRNIPIKYTDEILNEALVEFHGKYDCLYMPYDYEKNGNKGYAFINFVNPLHILYFYEKFNGKKWVHFESSKICELNCAHFQGINEIQKHAKNFKDLKKSSFNPSKENNMIIPSKYLLKLKKRFPKMQYNENKVKKVLIIKSFE